ncbi:MAG TPA: NUDIX domain-containing protein [Acholeplasmataceae bacterium]|nr:NUDIX domain-containing protein [Acholeplasmataceae bacterium]
MKETKFYYKNDLAPKLIDTIHLGSCAYIEYDKKLLLEKRSDSNRWGLIGGGLNIDESPEECILREIKEETGLVINKSDLKFIKVFADPSRIIEYPDGNVVRSVAFFYFVKLHSLPKLICSSESSELVFFNINDIKKLKIAETHKHIIDEFLLNRGTYES